MTSDDLKTTQTKTKSNRKNKNILKAGYIQKNFEINHHYLEEILDKNDIQMDLAMQIISTDKTVNNDTMQDLKSFNLQSLIT